MSNNYLFVGDLHAQVNNIDDTASLLNFIREVFVLNNCQKLAFLGDLFHTHAVVRQEVAYQLREFFKSFLYEVVNGDKSRVIVISGNHDGISPTITQKNALDLVVSEFATVISGDNYLALSDGFVFMPFVHDQQKFIETAKNAYNTAIKFNSNPVLVCHQTFDGAAYETGLLCPDGVDSDSLPYSVIISGHIHKMQVVNDKVIYIGTPRPVSFSEANDEKNIYLVNRAEDNKIKLTPISTKNVAKHYYVIDITEGFDENEIKKVLSSHNLQKDDVRLRITGSQEFYDHIKNSLSEFSGKVKFIPIIKKDFSKKINIESGNMSLEAALNKYVMEIADIDNEIREEVWKCIKAII